MPTNSFALNGRQKNALIHASDHAPIAPDFARTGEKNPNLRVFVANFDGTCNDRDNIPEGEQPTLVAKNHVKLRDSGNEAICSQYYRGVGTTKLPLTRIVQTATGMGCISNAEHAHSDFCKQVAEWRKQNPNVEIQVHVTGFSRGAATALHFLNLVDQRGAAPKGVNPEAMSPKYGKGAINSTAVLLDTVSTGQAERLNLTLPKTCIAVLHLVAQDEQRKTFPLREISAGAHQEIALGVGATIPGRVADADGAIHYSRIQEIFLPGVHSDIGGSYADGGIMKVSEFLMDNFQYSLGFDTVPVKTTVEHIQKCRLHDSRFDYEKIWGGETPKQNTQRIIEKVQSDQWDGKWAIESQIHGIANDTVNTFTIHPPRPRSFGDGLDFRQASLALMGKKLQVVFMPEDASSGMGDDYAPSKFGVRAFPLIESANAQPADEQALRNAIDIREDGIYFLGEKTKGLPSPSELTTFWKTQRDQDIEPTPISTTFSAWRVGMMATASQNPNVPTPLPAQLEADPWPQAIRSAVKRINENKDYTTSQATQIMQMAAKSVANSLCSADKKVVRVEIVPVKTIEKLSSGSKNTNRFTVTATDSDGNVFSTEKPPTKRSEREAHEQICALARGLGEVATGLHIAGFKTQNEVPFQYARQDTINPSIPAKHGINRMVPASQKALPVMISLDAIVPDSIATQQANFLGKLNKMRKGLVEPSLSSKSPRP